MVKEFSCDAVMPGCPARFEGESERSILEQMTIHAHEEHGMERVPPEVVEQVRAAIHDRDA